MKLKTDSKGRDKYKYKSGAIQVFLLRGHLLKSRHDLAARIKVRLSPSWVNAAASSAISSSV